VQLTFPHHYCPLPSLPVAMLSYTAGLTDDFLRNTFI
jgi:hypothetical protein